MPETLVDPETAHSYHVAKTAFNRAFRTELSMFDWLNLPENKRALKTFSMAMPGVAKLLPKDNLPQGK